MRLYFASGCPYAQRTRALLALLRQPFEARELDLAHKPDDFLAASPTGAVPLLQDGDLVLFESAVINEYLVEKFGWAEGLTGDAGQRARQRLAMKRFDEVLVPLFFRSLKDGAAVEAHPTWRRELAYFADVTREVNPRSLLGVHVAPFWLRMKWVHAQSPVVIALRAAAGSFLDAAEQLPEISTTTPDRDATVAALRAKFG